MKAFRKISLQPGESQIVRFALAERSFAIWDGAWTVPAGDYTIRVGPDSAHLPLIGAITVTETAPAMKTDETWYGNLSDAPSQADWEQLLGRTVTEKSPEKGHFTMANSVLDMKPHAWIMRVFYKIIEWTVAREFGGRKAWENPRFRMMITSAADTSLSSMKINGGLRVPILEALLEMANGHYGRALKVLFCCLCVRFCP